MTLQEPSPSRSATHRSARARRRSARRGLVLLAALLAVATSPLPSGAASAAEEVVLQDCLLSGVSFPVKDPGRHVPEGHALGSYGGDQLVAIWVLSCQGGTARGRLGPADLSIGGVLLEPSAQLGQPETWPNVLAPTAAAGRQWPANWPQYVVWAHTDNPELATALRRSGMPARTVPHIALRERYAVQPRLRPVDVQDVDTCSEVGPLPGAGHAPPDDVRAPEPPKATEVSVRWARSPYWTSVLPLTPHNTLTHCHDQLFWHGSGDDRSAVRIWIPVARDHFCNARQPGCGRAGAEPGSVVADVLESASRQDPVLAVDHERIREVVIQEVVGQGR